MSPHPNLCAPLAELLQKHRWMLATAESCTGGMIAAQCTDLAGSSGWFERGFVTYSNQSKSDMLGVDPALIDRHGAVSEEVAMAMAQGAVLHSKSQVSVAVTGIAGPGGGSSEKPIGTVWIAWQIHQQIFTALHRFEGDRAAVRQATMLSALKGLTEHLLKF